MFWEALAVAAVAATLHQPSVGGARQTVSERRVITRLMDPREHPDYARRAVQPPSWDTFGNRTQFVALRGFSVEGDRIVGYAEEMERFTRTFRLGNVIWPSYPILFASNLGEFADEVKRRGLFLFDIWGYVPGSGPGGYWQQFQAPREGLALLAQKLGDRWLGTDIGEQDGRYVGGYASQMTPASASREQQYLNFQRHFERMGDDLGHRHSVLVSLNFGHYLIKEGTYASVGAETAQALPNSQVYYAFIRGAGKQYGVPWFGNASIFNRWGFKTYGSQGSADGYAHGPTKGTSLSLLKRLLYSHILYNSVFVGFENGWFEGEKLSPIGRIQQAAQEWSETHGMPGVQHTPVALLLDFYSGWSFPRHLYADAAFRVWGNLPYEQGDYLTDGVLDMLYPGYRDASYFHDERGFLTPAPYGDIADCLLSDAPSWLLARYPLLIVAGALTGGAEVRDKLDRYVREGGHLIITAGSMAQLPGGLPRQGTAVETAMGPGGRTRVSRYRRGSGRVTLIGDPFGVSSDVAADVGGGIDKPLLSRRPLLPEVRKVLDAALREQTLFSVGEGLAAVTCRRGPGEYTVGVLNNDWTPRSIGLTSHIGPVRSVRELPLDSSERGAVGFTPEGTDPGQAGVDTADTIAGGSVRIFRVHVDERGVRETPHVVPGSRPDGRLLPLGRPASLKEAVLLRPTFFQHYGGVVLDWRYLREREADALAAEGAWCRRQGLRIAVDLSSGLNLYPDLRLMDNDVSEYARSRAAIEDVIRKMPLLGATELIVSLHRYPENNFSAEQSDAALVRSVREITRSCAAVSITVHLRQAFGKLPWGLPQLVGFADRVGEPRLKLAPSIAMLEGEGVTLEAGASMLANRVGMWLVSAPRKDPDGKIWDAHAPVAGNRDLLARARSWLKLAPEALVALDAIYADRDAEYRDAAAVDAMK